MPDWVCSEGGTLLIPSGQGNHLFVVLNNPKDFDGYAEQSCVSVSICSIRDAPHDSTRILKAGSHPFVNRDSYVAYRHARIDTAGHLQQLVKERVFVPLDPFRGELLQAIQAGLFTSPHTPNYLKHLQPKNSYLPSN